MEKLRVCHIPQIGVENKAFYVPVQTVEEGRKVIDILSAYDLFQLENNIKPDFCNLSILEQFNQETQEWESWESEDGCYDNDNLDDYFEENKELKEFSDKLFSQIK